MNSIFLKILNILYRKYLSILKILKIIGDADKLLSDEFSNNEFKHLIQVGGNDGVSGDPIRKYLIKKGNYKADIFEPLHYYFQKLTKLYEDRDDINLIQKFVSDNKIKNNEIFFIPSEIASTMDGEGPFNGWAHGQGSFSREFIENEIEKNSFRGKEYINKIQFFKSSIKSEIVSTIGISEIFVDNKQQNLLIIDVQGSEFNVINSINFENQKFNLIYYEDENPFSISSRKIRKLLKSKKYYFAGISGPNFCFKKNK